MFAFTVQSHRRFAGLMLALVLSAIAVPALASAEADSVAGRLDAMDTPYEVDEDGDYRIVVSLNGKRTQQVYVSGKTEKLGALVVREVFSPAATASLSGSDARKLLEDNAARKIGAWEIRSRHLMFTAKVLDGASGRELDALIDAVAQSADDHEKSTSGDEDAF